MTTVPAKSAPLSKALPPSPVIIESLYLTMERHLAPTGWWPAQTRFEIMAGAVLVQNAAWANADRSLRALRDHDALDPHAIAVMDEERLRELIRPSGFYRAKSRALIALSRWYVYRCGATPEGARDMGDDDLRAQLMDLPGVGGETADDLLLYVFDRRVFVADTYARRLFAFLGFPVPNGYPAFRRTYQPVVSATSLDVDELKEFHGLIDEFGKAYRDDDAKSRSFLAGRAWAGAMDQKGR